MNRLITHYSAYELTEICRNRLLSEYPPSFDNIICNHVTHKFPSTSPPPPITCAQVIGYYINHEHGIDCLVVKIDNDIKRSDGNLYHITLSMDSSKNAVAAKSNELLKKYSFEKKIPINLELIPKILISYSNCK